MEYLCVPTEHKRAILETVRRFVEDEVIPHAAVLDTEQDRAKCYSWEIVEKAHVARHSRHDPRREMWWFERGSALSL